MIVKSSENLEKLNSNECVVSSNLLGIKRYNSLDESLFFPKFYKNNKNIEINKKQVCFLEKINQIDWDKYMEDLMTYSNLDICEKAKISNLSSNLISYIFEFFETNEQEIFFNVNSFFRKMIIKKHKWLSIVIKYKKIFKEYPCTLSHKNSLKCLSDYRLLENLDRAFSNDYPKLMLKNFEFLDDMKTLTDEEKFQVLGNILCKLCSSYSNEIFIDSLNWTENSVFFVKSILNSCECPFDKISFLSEVLVFYSTKHHKFDFLNNSKIKYFSFVKMYLHFHEYSNFLTHIFQKKSAVSKVYFSTKTPEVQLTQSQRCILNKNIDTIFSIFIENEIIEEIEFANDYYSFKIQKRIDYEGQKKISLLETVLKTAVYLEKGIGFQEIFFSKILYYLTTYNWMITDLVFFSTRKNFLGMSQKTIKYIANIIQDPISICMIGPLKILNTHRFIKKIKSFKSLENIEMRKILFEEEEFSAMINLFKEHNFLKNLTLENLVVGCDGMTDVEFEGKKRELFQLMSQLREEKNFSISIPYFSNINSKELMDEKNDLTSIVINKIISFIIC